MADGSQISKLQRDAQQAASPEEAAAAQIDGRLKDLHTMMPGIIVSFDVDKQTAVVQPAIKRIFTERGPVNLPVCVDVPVAFPGGGDFFLTFPVKAGDECILGFSERAIDNWYASGGTQSPAEYRLHDLSDGIAQVGLNSQPNKLAAFNATDVELRTRDGSSFVQMKPDGTITNQNAAGSTVLSAAGKFTINAPGGFEVNAPMSTLNSAITNNAGAAGAGAKAVLNIPLEVQNTLKATGDVTTTAGITNNGHDIGYQHKHLNSGGAGLGGVVQ